MHTASRPSSKGRRVRVGETSSSLTSGPSAARRRRRARSWCHDEVTTTTSSAPSSRAACGDRPRVADGGAGVVVREQRHARPAPGGLHQRRLGLAARQARPAAQQDGIGSRRGTLTGLEPRGTDGMKAPVPPVGVAEDGDEPRHGVDPGAAWLPAASRSP